MRTALLAAGSWLCLSINEASAANRSAKTGWDLHRRYITTPDAMKLQDQALYKFRILSWNVLAESWTTFSGPAREFQKEMRWRQRRPRILRELKARNAHILVLQELEDIVYHWEVLPELSVLGYHGVFACSQQSRVGVAVLWKTNHFSMSLSMDINLGEPYHSRWYMAMSDLSRQQQERFLVLSANRAAMFVVLVPRFISQKPKRHALLLCAAHLSSIQHDTPTGLDVQTFQAALLLEALDDVVKQHEAKNISVNVIIAADLNTQASYPAEAIDKLSIEAVGQPLGLAGSGDAPSPVYDFFTKGFLRVEALGLVILAMKAARLEPSSLLFNEFQEMLVSDWRARAMVSVHAQALKREPHTCVDEQADYILFNNAASSVAHLALLGILVPPDSLNYPKLIKSIGSDHIPLVADFALIPP